MSLFRKAVDPEFAILLETTCNSFIAVTIPERINPNILFSLHVAPPLSKYRANYSDWFTFKSSLKKLIAEDFICETRPVETSKTSAIS